MTVPMVEGVYSILSPDYTLVLTQSSFELEESV